MSVAFFVFIFVIWALYYFLTQDDPGWSCQFPALGLEVAISPEGTGSFYWRTTSGGKTEASCAHCSWGSSIFFSCAIIFFMSKNWSILLPFHPRLLLLHGCHLRIRIIKSIHTGNKGGWGSFLKCFFTQGYLLWIFHFKLLSIFMYLLIFCSGDAYRPLFRKILRAGSWDGSQRRLCKPMWFLSSLNKNRRPN